MKYRIGTKVVANNGKIGIIFFVGIDGYDITFKRKSEWHDEEYEEIYGYTLDLKFCGKQSQVSFPWHIKKVIDRVNRLPSWF